MRRSTAASTPSRSRTSTTGSTESLPARGLFVLIGSSPHTAWLDGIVQRDEAGFLITGADVDRGATADPTAMPRPFETSIPGVFAIGDNRRGSVKRVATAVGDGAGVVQLLHGYLAERRAVPRAAGSDGRGRARRSGRRLASAALLRVAAVLVFLAGVQLFVFPQRTDEYFAWTSASPMTAVFLGASYWSAVGLELVGRPARSRWAGARIALPAVFVFTLLTLIVTLVHLELFHLDADLPLRTRAVAWAWIAVYAVVPVLMLVAYRDQRRVGLEVPPPSRAARRWSGPRWSPLAVAAARARAPRSCSRRSGPTGCGRGRSPRSTGRAVGAWLVGLGVAAAHARLLDDRPSLRPLAITGVLFGVLQGLAASPLRRRARRRRRAPHGFGAVIVVLAAVSALGALGAQAVTGDVAPAPGGRVPRSAPMAAFDQPLADTDDDTITAALELAVLPPLLAALAGDLGDPCPGARPPPPRPVGADGPHLRAVGRAGGRGPRAGPRRPATAASPAAAARPRPAARRAPSPARVRHRRRGQRRLPRAAPRRAGARRGPPRPRLAQGRPRARPAVPRRGHRRRDVRARRRPPPPPGRRRGGRAGEEPRRRRHLARELVPRLSRRRLQPLLLLLVRAAGRLARALLHPGGAARLLPRRRRRARAAPADPLRHRGGRRGARRVDRCAGGSSLREPDGQATTLDADAVVSGVGQLNRPNIPDLPGASTFAGPPSTPPGGTTTSTSRGQRVVVIGTGASAAQFIPEVAEEAAHLTILQRTPAWFLPTPDYHDAVEPEVAWLMRNVPGYANWLRFWNFWQNVEGLMVAARVDPDWDGDGVEREPDQRAGPPALRRPHRGGAGRPARPDPAS